MRPRHDLLPEHFSGCFVAETFARCCVQSIANICEIPVAERQWIDVSRQPFPGPSVGVFDRTFLPGRLRIAEPCLGSQACLQVGPVGEFGTAIEGDRTAGEVGQGLQHLDQPIHNRLRLPVIVAQEDGKAADALDQRRHIGLAELLLELHQIAFPMAKLLAFTHNVRPMQNVELRAESATMAASGMPWPTPGALLRKMSP